MRLEERRHPGERDLADPSLQVVRDALHQRHRDPAGRIDAGQVQQLLAVVRARLAQARDGA